jgi:uncharacterized membrane protein YcjF (UPF0283 family)
MPLATDYPFLNILWSMIIFFAWVIFIWIAITVLIDVFRRHDIGGWGKAAWTVFVIVLPFVGVLTYLIVNHQGMAERNVKQAKADQAQFDEYVRQAAGTRAAPQPRSTRPSGCSTTAPSPRPSSTQSRPRRSDRAAAPQASG